jgi:hypothetical protein
MSRAYKLILASTLVSQVVLAQPVVQPPPAEPLPGGAPSDANIGARQRATLSPQEMVTQATEYRTRMESTSKQIGQLVDVAKKEKDVIRLNCVTDKHGQVKANIVVADRALQDLRDAIGRRDEGESGHQYNKIAIVHSKVQVLSAEAQACVGQDLAFVGATQVEVDDSGVPPGNFTDPSGPDFPVDRPPLASPPS